MSFIIRTITLTTSVLGLTGNSLSLAYFLLHERSGLPNHLMILLNITDFLVEAYGLTYSESTVDDCVKEDEIPLSQKFFLVLCLTTGYLTLNLAVTRLILVSFPFYKIRKGMFYISLAVAAITIPLITFLTKVNVSINTICIVITATFLSTILTMYKLFQHIREVHEINSANSEGAKTVVYIGITFIILNTPLLIGYYTKSDDQITTILVIMIINSAANPLVFIVRKRMLREFALRLFAKAKAKVPLVKDQVDKVVIKLDQVKDTTVSVVETSVSQSILLEKIGHKFNHRIGVSSLEKEEKEQDESIIIKGDSIEEKTTEEMKLENNDLTNICGDSAVTDKDTEDEAAKIGDNEMVNSKDGNSEKTPPDTATTEQIVLSNAANVEPHPINHND